jgi:hypothetical protein
MQEYMEMATTEQQEKETDDLIKKANCNGIQNVNYSSIYSRAKYARTFLINSLSGTGAGVSLTLISAYAMHVFLFSFNQPMFSSTVNEGMCIPTLHETSV